MQHCMSGEPWCLALLASRAQAATAACWSVLSFSVFYWGIGSIPKDEKFYKEPPQAFPSLGSYWLLSRPGLCNPPTHFPASFTRGISSTGI